MAADQGLDQKLHRWDGMVGLVHGLVIKDGAARAFMHRSIRSCVDISYTSGQDLWMC
jgi:hypothetical protein